jgi:hypothetical protein
VFLEISVLEQTSSFGRTNAPTPKDRLGDSKSFNLHVKAPLEDRRRFFIVSESTCVERIARLLIQVLPVHPLFQTQKSAFEPTAAVSAPGLPDGNYIFKPKIPNYVKFGVSCKDVSKF